MLTNPPCPIILCASTGDCVCSIQWALSPRSEADEEVLLQVKMQQGIFLLTVDILIPLLNLCWGNVHPLWRAVLMCWTVLLVWLICDPIFLTMADCIRHFGCRNSVYKYKYRPPGGANCFNHSPSEREENALPLCSFLKCIIYFVFFICLLKMTN